ncbi:folate-binding Fe/S cluster repair protein [Acinetobacter qingfengensis]|uniref:Aminomethyltransferase n=1 Tax=Acinetobacter qingfengensis TaxID=1262585 RepID=A0A1E7RFG5_9GAMM|nr:folate-binding protein YgfZ [Acinetobacter qingfengensis]KAA8732789.1 folate-binding Fe/S cluster repair protein [Acinetobacter qingfengensis]OEY98098.1 aminomethyltransferase [Acinetobacter qingfengensis]
MSKDTLQFSQFVYQGVDAEKFLQGQVTVNVSKLTADEFRPTAICDLKGRIHFGLWLKRHSAEHIEIVISHDLADEFAAHVKKYGAFSKAKLSAESTLYPAIVDQQASFTEDATQQVDIKLWQSIAIDQGQAWITQQTVHLFQPQELRLHQRHGVDYDKGCYLGQEIIARLWFKAKPKHWLHLITGQGDVPAPASQLHHDVEVVNSLATTNGWKALVSAKPEALTTLDVQILDLPEGLNGDVARAK